MLEDKINIRMSNAPKVNEPGHRLIGFVVHEDELEHGMGWFSPLLEKYAVLYLQTKGYKVEKDPNFNRHTEEVRLNG